MPRLLSIFILVLACASIAHAQAYELNLVDIPGGTFTMGEAETTYQGPPGTYDALVHAVTLGDFRISETEITNQQYVDFLNAALAAGLVEVRTETAMGPDQGQQLVYGTGSAPTEYAGVAILNLSGTRVMKDHDNGDGDGDSFTGAIEPENPLNISYVGYDDTRAAEDWFYVKDPRDANDFDWTEETTYYNYAAVTNQLDTSVSLNDYANWPELADYPNNLPTVGEVMNWPASFVRWYGAKAFALFYELELPTEAEWEYAAQGGAAFVYATDDGLVDADGTSAIWNHLQANPALGHVEDVKVGASNPYGLYNMAGNVWEWVEDWYDAGFYADATDPVNTSDTGFKVRRGGSWNYHQSTLKTAARARDEQFKGNDHFGFRVVSHVASGTDKEPRPEVPSGSPSAEVFPNPFSGRTTIQYAAYGAHASVMVYDVLGRLVRTLVDEFVPQGFHHAAFDGTDLPSGVYFVQVSSARGTAGASLLLVR